MAISALPQFLGIKQSIPRNASPLGRAFLFVLPLIGIDSLQAQEQPIFRYKAPEVIESPMLKYPLSAGFYEGADGLVEMEFCVEADGSISNPQVIDSLGGKAFEDEAFKHLHATHFMPAMKNGEPIRYCDNSRRFLYLLSGTAGSSKEFLRKYELLNNALVTGRLDEAEKSIASLLNRRGLNLYEYAWLQIAQAQLAIARGQDDKALEFIKAASFNDGAYIEPRSYAMIQAQRFIIELKQQMYGNALSTYQSINASETKPENFSQIESVAKELMAKFRSDAPLGVPIKLDNQGEQSYTLFRNRVSLQVPEGGTPPDEVMLACTQTLRAADEEQEAAEGKEDTEGEESRAPQVKILTYYDVYSFAPGQVWQADVENYECKIKLKGQPSQAFVLVQHPD